MLYGAEHSERYAHELSALRVHLLFRQFWSSPIKLLGCESFVQFFHKNYLTNYLTKINKLINNLIHQANKKQKLNIH